MTGHVKRLIFAHLKNRPRSESFVMSLETYDDSVVQRGIANLTSDGFIVKTIPGAKASDKTSYAFSGWQLATQSPYR